MYFKYHFLVFTILYSIIFITNCSNEDESRNNFLGEYIYVEIAGVMRLNVSDNKIEFYVTDDVGGNYKTSGRYIIQEDKIIINLDEQILNLNDFIEELHLRYRLGYTFLVPQEYISEFDNDSTINNWVIDKGNKNFDAGRNSFLKVHIY
jgi:hypothetical protein